jgi:hypothetical protein
VPASLFHAFLGAAGRRPSQARLTDISAPWAIVGSQSGSIGSVTVLDRVMLLACRLWPSCLTGLSPTLHLAAMARGSTAKD